MDPHWPASSALPPHLRGELGAARLRAHWLGDGLVRALGVREPMPRGVIRRPGGTGDLFLVCFHQPTQVRLPTGLTLVPANSLVAWLPGMTQEYGVATAAWLHSWLHLRDPLASTLSEAAGLSAGSAIPLPSPDVLETALIDVHAEITHPRADPAIVESLIAVLIRRLGRCAPTAADPLAEVHRRIASQPEVRPRLDDLATLAGCTPQHLCRAFQRRYGTTPVALAGSLRLERAAHLLRHGLTPTAAAQRCGWADVRQFARVFQARFGHSPAAWRDAGMPAGAGA